MSREELKEIVAKVVERLARKQQIPPEACLFWDYCKDTCDVTTVYSIGEES